MKGRGSMEIVLCALKKYDPNYIDLRLFYLENTGHIAVLGEYPRGYTKKQMVDLYLHYYEMMNEAIHVDHTIEKYWHCNFCDAPTVVHKDTCDKCYVTKTHSQTYGGWFII